MLAEYFCLEVADGKSVVVTRKAPADAVGLADGVGLGVMLDEPYDWFEGAVSVGDLTVSHQVPTFPLYFCIMLLEAILFWKRRHNARPAIAPILVPTYPPITVAHWL